MRGRCAASLYGPIAKPSQAEARADHGSVLFLPDCVSRTAVSIDGCAVAESVVALVLQLINERQQCPLTLTASYRQLDKAQFFKF
jgi:hypothetical protein